MIAGIAFALYQLQLPGGNYVHKSGLISGPY